MGQSYNAGASFPGLWPGMLFGYQPMATAFGQNPLQQQGQQPFSPFGQNDMFAMGGQNSGMMQMQQQLMAALMMQSLIQMLVDYFAQGMGGPNGAGNGGGGGGGGGRNAGAIGGGNNWGGGRQTNWGPRPGNSGVSPRGNTHGHDHGHTDGPRSSGQRGIPDGLRPNAANGARVVREMGFTGTIGGIGHRSGASDHPHGNAIDVMTNSNRAQGRQIAEHFRQNHDQLGVKYVIFEQMIASPRTNWQWRRMEDRGSPTANHMDHPHISFH